MSLVPMIQTRRFAANLEVADPIHGRSSGVTTTQIASLTAFSPASSFETVAVSLEFGETPRCHLPNDVRCKPTISARS